LVCPETVPADATRPHMPSTTTHRNLVITDPPKRLR
jgi:hypothetical protein